MYSKSNNGQLESDSANPGTATIDVGDPSPQANPQDAMTGVATPVTLTLSGWHVLCENDPLTFELESGPAGGDITASDPATGLVTYRPHIGFEGLDTFWFSAGDCGFRSGPQPVNILVVSAPELTTDCRERHLVLQWTLPEKIQPYSDSLTYTIYRCETTPGNSCTPYPGTPYATVSKSQARSYVDTDVESGKEYCYQVTFSYQDPYTVRPYESLPSPVSCEQLCPVPSILITGNNFDGPIQTFDFTDGSLVNSFTPDHPTDGYAHAIAMKGTEIFYYDHNDPNDNVHVCPYGVEGSGGHDTWAFDNPDPRQGAAVGCLAFHNGFLYALTGYGVPPGGLPPHLLKLNVDSLDQTVTVVADIPIVGWLGDLAVGSADGFTVLPNGNLLVNNGDASPLYHEYSAADGTLVPGGLTVDISQYSGLPNATGVAVAPDGLSLYFVAAYGDVAASSIRPLSLKRIWMEL